MCSLKEQTHAGRVSAEHSRASLIFDHVSKQSDQSKFQRGQLGDYVYISLITYELLHIHALAHS